MRRRWGVYAMFHEGPELVARCWFQVGAVNLAIDLTNRHYLRDRLEFRARRIVEVSR